MAKMKEIHVTCRRLIAIPKYENVLYECSATVSLDPGDDPDMIYEDALQFCKSKVGAELDRLSDIYAVQTTTSKRIS